MSKIIVIPFLSVLFLFAPALLETFGDMGTASAQAATYYPNRDTSTNLGGDGTCNVTGLTPYTSATQPGKTTAGASEAGGSRYYFAITAGNIATALNVYTPVYSANPVDISTISASAALRGVSATNTVQLDLYDYDPAGASGNGTLVASSSPKTITGGATTTQYTWIAGDFTINGTGRVAQGHQLQFRFTWYSATAGTLRVYFGGGTATTSVNFTVTETAVVAAAGSLQLSAATYSVNESGGSVDITVSRTGGSSGAIDVDYDTADGTAISGSDYTLTSGTLSWADGDSTDKAFSVPIIDDVLIEGTENFTVSISNPTGVATLGAPSSATVTITDNDTAPIGTLQFSTSSYSVVENAGSVTITVSRLGGSAGAVGVNYATGGGTATNGSDFTGTSGTLTWSNGDTADRSFNINIINDGLIEGNENFSVTLTSPTGGATQGSPSSATVTIIGDDSPSVPAGSALLYALLAGAIAYFASRKRGQNTPPAS